jgi:large subunit ribosomal protein L30
MTEATAKKAPAKKAAAPKKAAAKTGKRVRITQLRSAAGRFANQRATLIGLRLNKIGRVSELEDSPAVRGMIKTVAHLVEFEEVA